MVKFVFGDRVDVQRLPLGTWRESTLAYTWNGTSNVVFHITLSEIMCDWFLKQHLLPDIFSISHTACVRCF